MGWIDITQPLNQHIATWAGDTSFRYETVATKAQTGSVNVGMLQMSLHSGTHMDAPFHFNSDGKTFEQLDFTRCIGKAVVVECLNDDLIEVSHIQGRLAGANAVLFKTKTVANPHIFPAEVPTLTIETVHYLREHGINLIGVDVPSVDKVQSKSLPIHHALEENDIYIVENLLLEHVQEGRYDMIIMPLLIEGADGSPVRAVIKEEE
ncbi:arylformamidase [Lysinibacillus piscis]|uniref:Arylformamidase n=1 Tax=Lysinibacillus piscis TaxID=2518931 RepID=A0ABQ5NN32_9BACI|nr:arylformamidase [Lysinibacillus sp. KH24]GLC89791.1 kynurenine formamidase [Lysinibacillus sp. KH24]